MTIHRQGRGGTLGTHARGPDAVADAMGASVFGGVAGRATIFGPSKVGGGRCAIIGRCVDWQPVVVMKGSSASAKKVTQRRFPRGAAIDGYAIRGPLDSSGSE
jgi:hypothetical protein